LGEKGHAYFHPFGTFGRNFDTVSLHHYWLQAREAGKAGPLDDCCMAWRPGIRRPLSRRRFRIHGTSYQPMTMPITSMPAYMPRSFANMRKREASFGLEGKIAGVALLPETGFV
jgi:tryptophan halogenase